MCGFGELVRLVESNGRRKAATGELTPMKIRPPKPELKAILEGGEVYWVDKIA